jgi:hypothetical protein
MADPRLLKLKADLYATAGGYNHARGLYIAARAARAPAKTVNETVARCYELGWSYTAALDRLLDCLVALEPTGARDAEIERAERVKELIRRELELITLV